jgi:hypothetical protein
MPDPVSAGTRCCCARVVAMADDCSYEDVHTLQNYFRQASCLSGPPLLSSAVCCLLSVKLGLQHRSQM